MQGGIYWLQIVDYYASSLSLMYIAFFECVAIVWIYGAKRLSSNVKDMTGKYPNVFFRVCWVFISPLLILVKFQNLIHFTNQFDIIKDVNFRRFGRLVFMTTRLQLITKLSFRTGLLGWAGVFLPRRCFPFQLRHLCRFSKQNLWTFSK